MVSAAILNSSADAGNVGEIASDDFMLRFSYLFTFELFSQLWIVWVLETALAIPEGKFQITTSRDTSQC